MLNIVSHGAEEEHGKECLWQIGGVSDTPIEQELKLGPQTLFGAKSQSERTIQLVPKLRKW